MHNFQETRHMPYDAKLINQIINDIEKYPEFLPWIDKVKIMEKKDNEIIAEVFISFKGFVKSYVCSVNNRQEDNVYFTEVKAISGPFSHLFNKWEVKSVKNGSLVDFSIDFELRSMILDKVVGMVFMMATEKMIEAFENHAKKIESVI